MTSACGVVEATKKESEDSLDDSTFYYEELHARGDIFEEFYYNLESLSITKEKPLAKRYTVGDEIEIKGDSYSYPENFDILVLRDGVAIEVRDKKIEAIVSIDDYNYAGYPLTNGRGFGILVSSEAEYKDFLKEYKESLGNNEAVFTKKWIRLETYRSIAFHSNFYMI